MTAAGPSGGARELRAALPAVAAALPAFLPAQRWFGGKEHAVERVEIRDTASIPDHPRTLLAVVTVHAVGRAAETYFLPLGLGAAAHADTPGAVIARHGDLVVRDAIADPDTCRALLRGMLEGQTLPTAHGGRFVFQPAARLSGSAGVSPPTPDLETIEVRHAGVEQSNSSIVFGSAFILKALRRLAPGVNPEIEIPRFLGQYTTFDRVPALLGWAEYVAPDGASAPVGVLQRFVPNQGDGWSYVLQQASAVGHQKSGARRHESDTTRLVRDMADLGRTLGGLHLALASRSDQSDFAPEPIDAAYVAAWQQRTRASLDEIVARLRRGLQDGPADTGWSAQDRAYGTSVLAGATQLGAAIDGFGVLARGSLVKTRHHGDFHLGQTLVAADGWIVIDFEGEPLRSLEERRAKQTPLRDVAGVLRSLDYALATAARQPPASPPLSHGRERGLGGEGTPPTDLTALFAACRESLLAAYVATIRGSGVSLIPASPEQLSQALLALEVEKALYELAYELGNRPDWVSIPLSALARYAQSRAVG
ncbi:MAG: hypothetical protein U0893_27625 [Chloroflexota bacterium]